MSKKRLTEILPGAWYNPDTVIAIQVYAEVAETISRRWFRRITEPVKRPRVVVFCNGNYKIAYTGETMDEILAMAKNAANAVNETRPSADAVTVEAVPAS